jgi:putative flippase GtrA
MSMATSMLDRVTRGRGDQAIKYSMVSVFGVVTTQVALLFLHGILGWPGAASNVWAVTLTAVPVFMLNKRWVWGRSGPAHMRNELLPFWAFTLAGLVLSTVLVTIVDHWSDSTLLVHGANIAGFGVLWVAKFLFLDQVMFGQDDEPAPL